MRIITSLIWFCLSFLMMAEVKGQTVIFSNISDFFSEPHSFVGGSEMGGGVSFVDFNQDGYDDLTFTTNSDTDIYFYENNQSGGFERVYLTGVSNLGNTKHPLWGDIDNDGDYDLFVSANETGNHLYLNTGNLFFIDITNNSGIDSYLVDNNSMGCLFADFNKDGNLDLYVVNRTIGGVYLPENNLMYYGNGDGTFNDVSVESNTQDALQAPFCPIAFDYDDDNYEDIYIAQDKYYGNTMLKNVDGSNFIYASAQTQSDIHMDGMNADVGDVDNNGFLDIYCTNTLSGSVLLMNNGLGEFTNEASERNCDMAGEAGWGAVFVDIDNDLDLDLFASAASFSTAYHDNLFLNDGEGNFTSADSSYGLESIPEDFSFGNMFGDINNDGFPDLVASNQYTPSVLWKNGTNSNNWIKYRLEGTVSNKDAIGAYLRFYLDGESYLRSTHAGQGFLSQQSFIKTFGMGTKSEVDSVEVTWPSGHKDWYYRLEPGGDYEFIEGSSYSSSIQSSEGDTLCPGQTSVLSIEGTYDYVIWNGEIEAEMLEVNSEGLVTAQVFHQFGIYETLEFDVQYDNTAVQVVSENEFIICPEVESDEVQLVVTSEFDYDIYWNGEVGGLIQEFPIGIHEVSVVNSLGCESFYEFEILEFEQVILSPQLTNPGCYGGNDGEIVLDIEGELPFSIYINDEESGLFNNNLNSGVYNVFIQDGNGCTLNEEVELIEPQEITYTITTTPENEEDGGSISLSVEGGVAPYYLNGDSKLVLIELQSGLYNIEICDSNQCCFNEEVEVEFVNHVNESEMLEALIFPNPSEKDVYIQIKGVSDLKLALYDMRGKEVDVDLVFVNQELLKIDLQNLSAGNYILKSGNNSLSLEIIKK